jgi:5-hydroxyisourate hydrolase-like protein (transthyretin family)
MTRLLSLWVLCSAISAAQAADAPDVALLPPSGFLQIWNRTGNHRVFTASDLYGHIDGGAEIFLEFGFQQLTLQRYVTRPTAAGQPAGEIQVEIYRMTDPIAAAGIYLMNCGQESRDLAFSERHCLSKYQLIFKRDRYYVIVNNTTGDKAFRTTMLDFARHIAARLPAEQPLKIDLLLPKDGLVKSSLRLLRGPYGLQSIFTLGEGDVMQLGRKITAVSGRYRDANGEYSLILADYPSTAAAKKAFDHLRTHLDSHLTVQGTAEGRLVFKDYEDKFGLVSVSGKRISVMLHLSSPPRSR